MSRFMIALLVAMAASGTAESADRALLRHGWHRTAVLLPAGLPRPHYNFRTTISYDAPYPYRRAYAHPVYVYEAPEVLFTPVYAEVPYLGPWIGAGSLTLPGYTYDYQGPYHGGIYVPYWDRLPYACGAYGYC
jgi:hypothetical protein